MSKLDDIFDEMDKKSVRYGGIETFSLTRPKAKQEIKDLMLELTNDEYEAGFNRGHDDPVYTALVKIRKKVEEL